MSLNEDLIHIQGIVLNLEKTDGPLKTIRYRGGNEGPIISLTTQLHTFLFSKKYIKNNKLNVVFDEQLKNICLFLILNTDVKTPISDFPHLTNIMPQLSTCVVVNVILGLDLSKHFCKALFPFNASLTQEFLEQVVPCLKKCKPKDNITHAYEFLRLIISQLCATPNSENIEKLTDFGCQILLNLTGLHGDNVNAKSESVYECIGLTLLNLLDLLIKYPQKIQSLEKIKESLIRTCCSIMMAVTLDVFCFWAEVEHENEVFQSLIAKKSYYFIEKYQKQEGPEELISMLGTIAKKPKSIQEQIYTANESAMIAMINKADNDQKEWFTALINTQVLKSKASIKCVEKWAHLCSIGDVSRLLNMSTQTNDEDAKNLVIKCAAVLEFEELVLATTRYFYQNGINKNLKENVQPQLVLLFNKIIDKAIGEQFCKELYLLLLQNPEKTLTYTFSECCKNSYYSSNLDVFWNCVKEVISINKFGLNILKNEIQNNKPDEQNCKSYIVLFNVLIGKELFTNEEIAIYILLPLLQQTFSQRDYSLVRRHLEILKDLQGTIYLREFTIDLFNCLLDVITNCRCGFLTFDSLKQEIVNLSVHIISKSVKEEEYEAHMVKCEEFFALFYQKQLLDSSAVDVLTYFFPISFEKHAETVAHLLKILPSCVTPEWFMISSKLINHFGAQKTIELLCDSLILMCELVNSQKSETEESKRMFKALDYYLHNLGIAIKESIIPSLGSPSEDAFLTKNVCRLIKDIPNGELKSEIGLSLASLLSEASLRSLRPDKKFATLVASINEPKICKMLAQKILS